MPLTENEIRNMLALDDARLREVILQICDAVGADRSKSARFAAAPNGVRAMISSMSADEVNRLIERAGRGRSESILDSLRRK